MYYLIFVIYFKIKRKKRKKKNNNPTEPTASSQYRIRSSSPREVREEPAGVGEGQRNVYRRAPQPKQRGRDSVRSIMEEPKKLPRLPPVPIPGDALLPSCRQPCQTNLAIHHHLSPLSMMHPQSMTDTSVQTRGGDSLHLFSQQRGRQQR